ncbi:MAG: GNAT family N-acetyltransferase [Ginsengibacter sp.]
MLQTTIVTKEDELIQIHRLNQQNLRQYLSAEEKQQEGFVSWLYSMELLQEMHNLAPSIIVKDMDAVIGYALVTLKEAATFHRDLQIMIDNLHALSYHDKPLYSYDFYCMGQVCIHKDYRGKGVFNMLYQKHREIYSSRFQLLVTEISASNLRSQKAHENVGFKTMHTYHDEMDEWNVVVWDWR